MRKTMGMWTALAILLGVSSAWAQEGNAPPAAPKPESVPAPKEAPSPAPAAPISPVLSDGPAFDGCHSCCHPHRGLSWREHAANVCEWLFYRPILSGSLCGCCTCCYSCGKCPSPCCTPDLYTFFLCEYGCRNCGADPAPGYFHPGSSCNCGN